MYVPPPARSVPPPSTRLRPGHRCSRNVARRGGWLALALLGCSAEYAPVDAEPTDLFGTAEAAVAACEGDDLQYDFNAFAASLAVAIANERGRWDVVSDFEIRDGKLELSSTGRLHCDSGCDNVEALLRLQDDASRDVPFHSPQRYRSKLTGWYASQESELRALVDDMLHVDKGVYRIVNVDSGRPLSFGGGVTDKRTRRQRSGSSAGGEEWRVVLEGTMHRLINVKSGKCLDLNQDTWEYQAVVERACSNSHTQRFDFAFWYDDIAIRTSHLQTVAMEGSAIVQVPFAPDEGYQVFAFEPVGSGAHVALDQMATAVYSIKAKHSGKAMGVAGGSLRDDASVEVATFAEDDDTFHWYLTPVGGRRYRLMNRRSGKCLDLADPQSPTSALAQRTCSTAESQIYYFVGTGEGHRVLYTTHGVAIGVQGGSMGDHVPVVQGDQAWSEHQLLRFEPLMAGEPHALSFSHATDDGPCGDYYWYEISQPNGLPLEAPGDSYVQLIFAGGKTSLDGRDDNPFIAQQVTGNLVAIDPSGYMNGGAVSRSGSCVASDIAYDATGGLRGACCVRYNGRYGAFRQSFWSATTFLCR